jgi:hypothetical protein
MHQRRAGKFGNGMRRIGRGILCGTELRRIGSRL